jgi:hypothetical protein
MATTIIIGSGQAHQAIQDMNTAGMNWTDAQRANASKILLDFVKEANGFTANPQPV